MIVGEEVRTADGDLICLFLERGDPARASPADEAIAAARAQGGLVGIPHPFDRFRGSLLRDARMERLAPARSTGSRPTTPGSRSATATQRAAEFALAHGLPGIAVSDAHSAFEVGVAYTALDGDPSTAGRASLAALPTAELVTGRASFYVRLLTPLAKVVQRARGNGRIQPTGDPRRCPMSEPRPTGRRRRSRRRAPSGRATARSRPVRPRPRAGLPSAASVGRRIARRRAPERRGDRRAPATTAGEARPVNADSLSLGRRLRQPRTIISLVLPIVLLVLSSRARCPASSSTSCRRDRPRRTRSCSSPPSSSSTLGFPLRGLRWALLIRGTGFRLELRDATEIIFISWLVNCLVPAKLGDLYRAYLLKINSPVSLSRTFGTVFIERILDLFAIVGPRPRGRVLELPRAACPAEVQVVFAIGVGVVIVLAVGAPDAAQLRAPDPRPAAAAAPRRSSSTTGSRRACSAAVGAARSCRRSSSSPALIWATEAMRLFLVVQALGFPDVQLGICGAFFVALIGSLLTAVPLTPGRARHRRARASSAC